MASQSSLTQLVKKLSLETENRMKAILAANGKTNSRIFASLRVNVEESSGTITVSTDLPSYAVFVDKGRRPGKQPPLDAIIDWCKRKNIDQKAAFPIARNIGKNGIPATNFMDPMRLLSKLIAQQASTVVANDIRTMIQEMQSQFST